MSSFVPLFIPEIIIPEVISSRNNDSNQPANSRHLVLVVKIPGTWINQRANQENKRMSNPSMVLQAIIVQWGIGNVAGTSYK